MATQAVSKLTKLKDLHREGVKKVLAEALEDADEFNGVFVAALVDGGDYNAVRIYYAGLNRLERGGILEEAADLVRNPEEAT